MADPRVLLTREEGIAVMTINRPEARNALDPATVQQFQDTLRAIAASKEIRAVVLTGAGTAFCAGADLKARQRMTPEETREHSESIMECANLLERLPVPVIAAINGPAMAGGIELALGCDFRLASEKSTFALTEISLGVFPGAGAPLRLPRLVGLGWTKLLVLTGERLGPEDALRIGLVEKLLPADRLMEEAVGMAKRIAGFNPEGVRAAKLLMNSVPDMPLSAAMVLSGALRHPLNTSREWQERVKAFGEKRAGPTGE